MNIFGQGSLEVSIEKGSFCAHFVDLDYFVGDDSFLFLVDFEHALVNDSNASEHFFAEGWRRGL